MELTVKEVETLRNDRLGPKVAENFQKHHFDAWYFSNREDALKHIESIIPKDHVVSWGGSLTLEALGIKPLVKGKFSVIDRDTFKDQAERAGLQRKALTCDTFFCGANAISESGELVQVDWSGNRVAAMMYGPKQVIIVAGMNKVVKTLKDAYERARTFASPMNMQRFAGKKTPCSLKGGCEDCHQPDCLCTYVVTVRNSNPAKRIKIVLINENLGF